MTRKQHGGHRPGAGRKSCRTDSIPALFLADELAVTPTHARKLLRDGECVLTGQQWRAVALAIEGELSDAEAVDLLKNLP